MGTCVCPGDSKGTNQLEISATPIGFDAEVEQAVMESRLFFMSGKGEVQAVKDLLAKGVSVNIIDYDKRSPLHIAAAEGNEDVVRLLMSVKADPARKDRWGHTALDEAIRGGFPRVQAVLPQETRSLGTKANLPPAKAYDPEDGTLVMDPGEVVPMTKVKSDVARHSVASMDFQELKDFSNQGHWSLPVQDIELLEELANTMKSTIHLALWRGTKVVCKTSKEPALQAGAGEVSPEAAALREEMIHEIRLLATMRHPDLVMFLGACLDQTPPWFITEYMEGGDLDRYYKAQRKKIGHEYKPPHNTFLAWAAAVARALCFLHGCERPIIHRDLKPLNLLLTRSQDLKVTDFGISKLMGKKVPGADGKADDPKAMSGGVGTWRYMAPEVVRYQSYTDRVDIYSFALIMWFMSTGKEPFVQEFGKDAELVLKEYIKGNEPRPVFNSSGSLFGGKHEPMVQQLIKDCWDVTPANRPSARDCIDRLEAISTLGKPKKSNSGMSKTQTGGTATSPTNSRTPKGMSS